MCLSLLERERERERELLGVWKWISQKRIKKKMGFVGLNFGIRRDYIYRDKMGFGKPYFIYQMKIKERPYHLEYLKNTY